MLLKKVKYLKKLIPYFIEKYKELQLNKKAEEFKSEVYKKYSEKMY